MVHLMVHLPAQAKIAGPVHYRSMWPVERFLVRLKGSVCTKSHPEGSILEWSNFIISQCLKLFSRYLHGEAQLNRQVRTDEDYCTTPFFRSICQGLVGKSALSLDHKTWVQAHRYVLFNYTNIVPYLEKHAQYLSSIGHRNKRDIYRMQHESFHELFRLHDIKCQAQDETVRVPPLPQNEYEQQRLANIARNKKKL